MTTHNNNGSKKAGESDTLASQRQLYAVQVEALRMRKGLPTSETTNHPWVREARLKKELDTPATEPAPPKPPYTQPIILLVMGVLGMLIIKIVFFSSPAPTAHIQQPDIITVWHSGYPTESRQLLAWSQSFSDQHGVQVVVEARSDLSSALIRAIVSKHAPSVAIIDPDTASRLEAGGWLLPIQMNASDSPQTALPLAIETTWTRSMVMVVPRGAPALEATHRLMGHIYDSLASTREKP